MRKLNYLIIVMMIATGLFMQSCEKDQAVEQQTAEVSFAIDNTGLDLKFTPDVPPCSDADMSYVEFTIDGVPYNSPVIWVDGMPKTQAIKLFVNNDGTPMDYTLEDFYVYDAQANLIMAAPAFESTYWDLMVNRLELTFTVEAFKKQEVIIDVLCYEELLYQYFGFVWFELNEVVIHQLCFFGDLCFVDDPWGEPAPYQWYVEYGEVMDAVAKMYITIEKLGDDDYFLAFDGQYLAEGNCLEVYWADDIDKDETFELTVYLYGPNGEVFMAFSDTFTDSDTEHVMVEGLDGMIDFVVGDCGDGTADYITDWTFLY